MIIVQYLHVLPEILSPFISAFVKYKTVSLIFIEATLISLCKFYHSLKTFQKPSI